VTGRTRTAAVRALNRRPAGLPAMTPSHDHCPPLEQHIAANLAGSPIWWLDCVALQQQAAAVLAALPTPYYAVKANSHPTVLRTLAAAGIRRFDIASVAELQRVQQAVPNAECAFMNPFKPSLPIASGRSG